MNNYYKGTRTYLITLIFLLGSQYLFAYVWPIVVGQVEAPMTSPFGPRLLNGHYDFHYGVDIRTQNSTTVVAAHNGYADWVGWNGDNYQLMVFLGEAYYLYATGYAHLSDTVNLNYPSLYPILEGDQIAVSGGTHLHFNYYTRNIEDEFSQGSHLHDADADHPMKILPYTNGGGPESPTDTWVGTGPNSGHITSIQFDVLTDPEELDLNRLELTVLTDEFDTDFGIQYNINKNDGTNSTQTTVIQSQYGHGSIDLIITVHDFTVGNNQRVTIKYDFTGFNDGTHQGSVPGDNLYLWLFDVDNNGEYLSGFSAVIKTREVSFD